VQRANDRRALHADMMEVKRRIARRGTPKDEYGGTRRGESTAQALIIEKTRVMIWATALHRRLDLK
jgi:hypothetical protein